MEVSSLLVVKARPPPAVDIVRAFRVFFNFKEKNRASLEDIQAKIAAEAFTHLRDGMDKDSRLALATEDLLVALRVCSRRKRSYEVDNRLKLADLLCDEIGMRQEQGISNLSAEEYHNKVVILYSWILSNSGKSLKARDILEKSYGSLSPETSHSIKPWNPVLSGLMKEHNEEEVLRTIEKMLTHGVPFDNTALRAIITAAASTNDLKAMKRWYEYPIPNGGTPDTDTKYHVIKSCILHKNFEWGQQIVNSMLEQTRPAKMTWDWTFRWAAARGKGVDEIDRMMDVMVRKESEFPEPQEPDIETINALIELANANNDPYTAERYMSLAQRRGIQPNGRTYLLQLEYRLKVGDITGARSSHRELQAYEVLDMKDIPLLNKLILALCQQEEQDNVAIMEYVEELSQKEGFFEPETVSALCFHHLKRGELHEVIDLLQTHALHYEMDERASIRNTFVSFCLDRSNSISQAWDAYSIMRQVFAETDRKVRVDMMNEFFDRGRCDMAIHVFGHMRQFQIKGKRPTEDTYTQCFEGIAKSKDLASVKTVHNMMKLDVEIEPNTKLYNALMLAYLECGEPSKSLDFWEDIAYSEEGPTYNSIHIALRACEDCPWGDTEARNIWNKLQKFEIEVTKEIYTAYVGALAGQGMTQEAIQLLVNMNGMVGSQPDAFAIGVLHNASPGEVKKAEVGDWAKKTYPTLWNDLEKIGRLESAGRLEDGNFKIDRYVPA